MLINDIISKNDLIWRKKSSDTRIFLDYALIDVHIFGLDRCWKTIHYRFLYNTYSCIIRARSVLDHNTILFSIKH